MPSTVETASKQANCRGLSFRIAWQTKQAMLPAAALISPCTAEVGLLVPGCWLFGFLRRSVTIDALVLDGMCCGMRMQPPNVGDTHQTCSEDNALPTCPGDDLHSLQKHERNMTTRRTQCGADARDCSNSSRQCDQRHWQESGQFSDDQLVDYCPQLTDLLTSAFLRA